MKKFTLLLFFFIISSKLFPQMNVKSDIYITNIGIYVKQNAQIQPTGNILLRNEAQMLQGSTGTSTNTGAGKLSVFQEGTGNAYQYNYWCSPVGNASATVGNENFGITMLNRPTTLINSSAAVTTTQTGLNGVSNPLAIEPYWIWKYLSSGGTNDWIASTNTSTIGAGEGFTMKGTSGIDASTVAGVQNNLDGSHQRYDFRGKPNDGNITINVTAGLNYTLTGNPYPSAIDLSAFLFDATNSTGTAYFWESDKTVSSHSSVNYIGGYGTFTPISRGGTGIYVPATFFSYDTVGNPIDAVGVGQSYQRRFCPVGQGFMLQGQTTGTVIMKNLYRVFVKEGVANNSQFERQTTSNFLPNIENLSNTDYTSVSTLPVPQIRIKNQIGINGVQEMVLAFDSLATDNVDFGMDAPSPKDATEQELYFPLNNIPHIVSVIDFDINKRIPVGLRNTDVATYKISVADMQNFSVQNVYLHDKISDVYHDILNNFYEVTMPIGNNTTQFEITFTNSALAVENNLITNFDILQNNNNQTLNILNPKLIDIRVVDLFDISGKLIFEKSKLEISNSYKFSTAGLAEGIYIVKLISADGKTESKKVSIFKQK
jgi:hypothetical protein